MDFTRRMDLEQFWSLLEAADKEGGGDKDKQAAHLEESLVRLTPEDVMAFHITWWDQMIRSYRWDLWAAGYLINGGCSDDGFEYFRYWLIGKGRAVFEGALADPESLVEIAEEGVENEPLPDAVSRAYKRLTGNEFPVFEHEHYPKEPVGELWNEEDLDSRFPALAAKFG